MRVIDDRRHPVGGVEFLQASGHLRRVVQTLGDNARRNAHRQTHAPPAANAFDTLYEPINGSESEKGLVANAQHARRPAAAVETMSRASISASAAPCIV